MSRTNRLFLIVPFLIIQLHSFAQQSSLTGKITDAATGAALDGVSIRIKSSGTGITTGSDGSFTISANANDVLEITSIGYQPLSIKINGRSTIDIALTASSGAITEIVLVGSRGGGRIRTETPVPIDVININQVGVPTARMDLTSALNYAAPSFNYNKQSGADGADHIDLGTLRGLGPDQTLVLINGKRRHQTAFVGLFGTRGRGNSGADLNAFPEAAVDRIEILRDGASAQYGSDAMAGVINIVLKKDINHWTINTGYAGYYDQKYNALNSADPSQYYTSHQLDGTTFSFSVNNGFAIGTNGGFINLSLDFLDQGKTFRQVPDNNVTTNPKALPVNTSRRAFGDGSVTTGGGFYNMEIPFSANKKALFYSFGGYNYKAADAYAYTRNFSARPDRFPVNADGDLLFVPGIMRTSKDGETFYNPHIQTHITDFSIAAGIKGDAGNDWNWDLSNTIGRNNFHYYGDKTFNASLIGQTTPNDFDDGGFNFLQNTLNLDFSKSFQSIGEGLNLGLGTEFRYERYSIYKGEEASYNGYPNAFDQAPGSQGFPGFSPADEIKADRTNISAYADAELSIDKAWLVSLAVRFENYSDFGFVNTSKLATRYKLTHNFNLRGSISTGFRAPSLQQINFSNTLTSFSGGALVQSRIARNGDAVTIAAGIPDLKQETSINGSVGFSWKPLPGFTFTADGYMVKVKDRIVLSGLFSAEDASLPTAFTDQLKSLDVATAQFFDNAVSTTNFGLDIIADYTKRWGNQNIKILLAGNLQHMKVREINIPPALNDSYLHRKTFFSDREEAFLLASAPKTKFSLNLEYNINKFGAGAHLTYFGKIKLLGFGWTGPGVAGSGVPGDPDISGSFTGIDPYVTTETGNSVVPEIFNFTGKATTDVYASYKFSKRVSLFIGADNLFNVHPDLGIVPGARFNPDPDVGSQVFDNESGGPWDSVQMGFNGLRLFSKLVLNF
ncbi:MAG: TonB-dependent receptor [Ferruginibacter sp.]